MARFYKHLALLTSSFFLLTSCQEGGDAGDLFGQWRMADSNNKYISFSGSVVKFNNVAEYATNPAEQAIGGEIYGNFQQTCDSLFIQCYSVYGASTDTTIVEKVFAMKPFRNIRLKIESLNSDHLIITKGNQHWTLQKW